MGRVRQRARGFPVYVDFAREGTRFGHLAHSDFSTEGVGDLRPLPTQPREHFVIVCVVVWVHSGSELWSEEGWQMPEL